MGPRHPRSAASNRLLWASAWSAGILVKRSSKTKPARLLAVFIVNEGEKLTKPD